MQSQTPWNQGMFTWAGQPLTKQALFDSAADDRYPSMAMWILEAVNTT